MKTFDLIQLRSSSDWRQANPCRFYCSYLEYAPEEIMQCFIKELVVTQPVTS
jgi:hypothetical protein